MTMQSNKQKALEAAGWKIGSTEEFLALTPDEVAYIDMKLALGHSLRELRLESNLSQVALAKLVLTSQSRVAKMEAGDPSVSIDLLLKSLLALGATPGDVARTISTTPSPE